MKADKGWTKKDVWLGVLFLAVGILLVVFAFSAMRNDAPAAFWVLGWVAGPLLIFLGGHGVIRSLRAGSPK